MSHVSVTITGQRFVDVVATFDVEADTEWEAEDKACSLLDAQYPDTDIDTIVVQGDFADDEDDSDEVDLWSDEEEDVEDAQTEIVEEDFYLNLVPNFVSLAERQRSCGPLPVEHVPAPDERGFRDITIIWALGTADAPLDLTHR